MLLVHTPPQGRFVSCEDGRQVGRRAVNDLIEALGVRLVVCGHAHDGQGQERIGPALVVNPGPLSEGRYAIVDPHRGTVRLGVLPRHVDGRWESAMAPWQDVKREAVSSAARRIEGQELVLPLRSDLVPAL